MLVWVKCGNFWKLVWEALYHLLKGLGEMSVRGWRNVVEEECECTPALEKRVNQSPDGGWQDHAIGLIQQQLLLMKWDTATQVSQHWAAWDVGDFLASLLLPWTLSAEKMCAKIKEGTEGGECIRRRICVWGRQARRHWAMWAEWLCYARCTKFHVVCPRFPPVTLSTGLNHWCFPFNWPPDCSGQPFPMLSI